MSKIANYSHSKLIALIKELTVGSEDLIELGNPSTITKNSIVYNGKLYGDDATVKIAANRSLHIADGVTVKIYNTTEI